MKKVWSKVIQNLPLILYSMAALLVLSTILYGLNERVTQSRAIQTYERQIEEKSDDEFINQLTLASIYNTELMAKKNNLLTPSSSSSLTYDEVLQFSDDKDDPFGVIEIDQINVRLPIYKGTSDKVLEKGVGHFEDSELPIGQKGTHAVLTGHNGVPGLEMLFTRLDELDIGEQFKIGMAGHYYLYEIESVIVVTPEEADEFAYTFRNPNDATVSLVTCTPYGLNTHRRIFIAKLIGEVEKDKPTATTKQHARFGKVTYIIIGVSVLLVGLTIYQFIKYVRRKDKE